MMALIYDFVGQLTLFLRYFHVIYFFFINNAIFYVIYYKIYVIHIYGLPQHAQVTIYLSVRFSKKIFTVIQLLDCQNDWVKAKTAGDSVNIIYLDYSKAFVSVTI